MTLLQALILGIIQGATEFLPISSSGHLVLAETFLGLNVEGLLSFDVVLHAGTLMALILYFRGTLVGMAKGLWIDMKKMLKPEGRQELRNPDNPREQVWYLIVATLPVVFLAPFLKEVIEQYFRSASVVIGMMGVTAVLLVLAEVFGKRKETQMNSLKTALLMGFFQVMAIIPGISRSGSTIVGGLLGGLEREAAAKFAFLMAIPAIAGATIFLSKDLFGAVNGGQMVSGGALAVGFGSSMLVSLVCIYGMLKFLRKRSLWVFVGYLLMINGYWFLLHSSS
ncbi:MAG: undecaprenyl-diphosphate phosphatase [bacterium]|nr:undecaprenyl-diphosphate phosphatase [bacterium]